MTETVESDKAEQVSENLYAAVYSIIVYWPHDQQIMNIASSVATTATHLQVHAGQDKRQYRRIIIYSFIPWWIPRAQWLKLQVVCSNLIHRESQEDRGKP